MRGQLAFDLPGNNKIFCPVHVFTLHVAGPSEKDWLSPVSCISTKQTKPFLAVLKSNFIGFSLQNEQEEEP